MRAASMLHTARFTICMLEILPGHNVFASSVSSAMISSTNTAGNDAVNFSMTA